MEKKEMSGDFEEIMFMLANRSTLNKEELAYVLQMCRKGFHMIKKIKDHYVCAWCGTTFREAKR
jgi:hypothetical protein